MNNQEFIKYTAARYGIDENIIETFVDIFAVSLHELIHAGASVTIDEIGKFTPKHLGKKANAHLPQSLSVNFRPSNKLVQNYM